MPQPARPRHVRPLLAVIGTAALIIAAVLLVPRWMGTGAAGPFIVVTIDTLRADRLPAYGYTVGNTPVIDRLAADGVLFESAWAQSPQTLPSHTSLFTGRLPFAHGVRDNIGFSLAGDIPTLAERFTAAGYRTGAFVSSFVLRHQVGLARGFEHYDDLLPPAAPDRPLGAVQRAGHDTAAAATTWLSTIEGPRYLLWLHLYEPHAPYTPSVVPPSGDRYDGEVTLADEIVGTLVDALRARGDYDAATIVLLSDHGEGLGDHGEDEHGLFVYRSTIQTPLIVKLPGQRESGRRVTVPVQHIDLAPTLLTAAGLPLLDATHGRPLQPVLDGAGTLPPAPIYAEAMSARYHFGWSELYALTDERYRFIRAPRDDLFDLADDPGETRSITGDRPQVAAAMRAAIDRLIADQDVGAPSTVSDADRQRLAALGYVGTSSGGTPTGTLDDLPDPKDKVTVIRQYLRASALKADGRAADAVAAYRDLLLEEPGLIDAWLQMAAAAQAIGDRATALSAFAEVIARDHRNAAALTGAAGVLVELGRFDEARGHAELAVEVAPAQAQELLARLALQRGDPAAARSHAAAADAADPSLPMSDFIEGLILYNQGAYAASVAPLTRAVDALGRRTEQVADVRYVLADALARQQRFAEAERLFRDEVAAFPGHIRARTGLALVYWTTRRQADARQVLTDLAHIGQSNREAQAAAAQLRQLFGDGKLER